MADELLADSKKYDHKVAKPSLLDMIQSFVCSHCKNLHENLYILAKCDCRLCGDCKLLIQEKTCPSCGMFSPSGIKPDPLCESIMKNFFLLNSICFKINIDHILKPKNEKKKQEILTKIRQSKTQNQVHGHLKPEPKIKSGALGVKNDNEKLDKEIEKEPEKLTEKDSEKGKNTARKGKTAEKDRLKGKNEAIDEKSNIEGLSEEVSRKSPRSNKGIKFSKDQDEQFSVPVKRTVKRKNSQDSNPLSEKHKESQELIGKAEEFISSKRVGKTAGTKERSKRKKLQPSSENEVQVNEDTDSVIKSKPVKRVARKGKGKVKENDEDICNETSQPQSNIISPVKKASKRKAPLKSKEVKSYKEEAEDEPQAEPSIKKLGTRRVKDLELDSQSLVSSQNSTTSRPRGRPKKLIESDIESVPSQEAPRRGRSRKPAETDEESGLSQEVETKTQIAKGKAVETVIEEKSKKSSKKTVRKGLKKSLNEQEKNSEDTCEDVSEKEKVEPEFKHPAGIVRNKRATKTEPEVSSPVKKTRKGRPPKESKSETEDSEKSSPEKNTSYRSTSSSSSLNSPKIRIITSLLNEEQKEKLHKFSQKFDVCLQGDFTKKVTHLVTKADSSKRGTRSLKYLKAILLNKWIVSYDWIENCLEKGEIQPEEPYELKGTLKQEPSTLGAPEFSRSSKRKLFEGLSFFFEGKFKDASSPEIEELKDFVECGGGRVIENTLRLYSALKRSERVVIVKEKITGSERKNRGVVIDVDNFLSMITAFNVDALQNDSD